MGVKMKRRQSDGHYLPDKMDGLNRPEYAMQLMYVRIDGQAGMTDTEFQLNSHYKFIFQDGKDGKKAKITVKQAEFPLPEDFWCVGDQAMKNRRVTEVHMVVGNNGAGKTTLLREIMLKSRMASEEKSPVFIWGSGKTEEDGRLRLQTIWCTNQDIKIETDKGLDLKIAKVPKYKERDLWDPVKNKDGDFRALMQGNKLIYLSNAMGKPLETNYVYDCSLTMRLIWDANSLEERGNISFEARDASEAARNVIDRYYDQEIYDQIMLIKELKKKEIEIPGEIKDFLPDRVTVRPKSLIPFWNRMKTYFGDDEEERAENKPDRVSKLEQITVRLRENAGWMQYVCQCLMLMICKERLEERYRQDIYISKRSLMNEMQHLYGCLPEDSDSLEIVTHKLKKYCTYEENTYRSRADQATEACQAFWNYLTEDEFPKKCFAGVDFSEVRGTDFSFRGKDETVFSEVERFMEEYGRVSSFFSFLTFDWGLSSGEMNLLNQFSYLHQAATRFSCCSEQSMDKNETPTLAGNILLMIDEADLSYHPEWQQKYLKMLLSMLPVLFSYSEKPLDEKNAAGKIQNPYIQVILTTHSPILLADMPIQAVTYLKCTKEGKFSGDKEELSPTFGQNIYRLFEEGFSLSCPMGEFAIDKINGALRIINDVEEELDKECSREPEWLEEEQKKIEKVEQLADLIGDDFLKGQLHKKCGRCRNRLEAFRIEEAVQKPAEEEKLEEKIQRLKEELAELEAQRGRSKSGESDHFE